MDKLMEYAFLVDDVKKHKGLEKINLMALEESREINLWSYWEGGKDHLNARIMLVGQDWGTLNIKGEFDYRKIKALGEGQVWYMEGNTNMTNLAISELFKVFDESYDLMNDRNTYTDLFFTNVVPWYRISGQSTGDFKNEWIKESAPYFKRLVDIIEPKVIICLGRNTYETACKALDLTRPSTSKKYSDIIEEGANREKLYNEKTRIYPVAHPGYYGQKKRPLETQRKDWEKIKEYLDE